MNMNDLRLDYFIRQDLKLYQHKEHFHFNTDTRLLANFLKVNDQETVLDIGTNNGALLLWVDQFEVKKLYGVEVLKEAYDIARLNADTFFQHEHEIIHAPIQEVNVESVDVIISNPPFFTQKETHPNVKMDMRQLGRIEINLTLEELIKHANRLLKSNGRFYFVHRPTRMQEILTTLNQYSFGAKRVAFAYDKDHECKSILIEAIKERRCNCQILPPIEI